MATQGLHLLYRDRIWLGAVFWCTGAVFGCTGVVFGCTGAGFGRTGAVFGCMSTKIIVI